MTVDAVWCQQNKRADSVAVSTGPVFLLIAAVVGLVAVAYTISELNSSGRGLDNDDWEVDHSVWMNQLQKDFEDSWSVQ